MFLAFLIIFIPTVSCGGLYSADSNVKSVYTSTWNETIQNSSAACVVEFYNTWCSHCRQFAPIWQNVSDDISQWKGIVMIAAVECTNEENVPLCRHYNTFAFPSIKYISPYNSDSGDFPTTIRDIGYIRHQILDRLIKDQQRGYGENWPKFSAVQTKNLKNLWNNISIVDDDHYVILVVETNKSYTGLELMMDFHNVTEITVFRSYDPTLITNSTNFNLTSLPHMFAISKNLTIFSLNVKNKTRTNFSNKLQAFLNSTIYMSYADGRLKTIHVTNETLTKDFLTTTVFLEDIENALRHSLYQEIPIKMSIENDSMDALRNFVNVLHKFLPIANRGSLFLKFLAKNLEERQKITGYEFRDVLDDLEKRYPVFSNKNYGYVACNGSEEFYRGYPCGMWVIYHTLTVQSANKTENLSNNNTSEVLTAILGYMKHFFGCSDCSKHFQQLVRKMNFTSLKNVDDTVLWLWKAHNIVNERLKNTISEDPAFPKIQFPSVDSCGTCYNENGTWNEQEVLSFLKNMYSRVHEIVIDNNNNNDDEIGIQAEDKIDPDNENLDISNIIFLVVVGLVIVSVLLYAISTCLKSRYKWNPSEQHRFTNSAQNNSFKLDENVT